ncbi:MAG: nucleoside kinase [Aggregatilineales bacterium]
MTNTIQTTIIPSHPRDEIRVAFPDATVLSAPIRTSAENIMQAAEAQGLITYDAPLIAVICNGKLRELTHILTHDSELSPVCLSNSDGGRIYRRSLVLLLVTAFHELWQERELRVDYAIPDGGFYCEPDMPLTSDEIQQLEARMQAIVADDVKIDKSTRPLKEVIELYKKRGDEDRVQLLQNREENTLNVYTLNGRSDYYYGYMVPSTRYLSLFKVIPVDEGFILQYPRKNNPTALKDINPDSKLIRVFHQMDEWLETLNVPDFGKLNTLIYEDRIQELILITEALHEQNVARISTEINVATQQGARIVLIAGPSSAGKTTFSKRLAIQLLAHGLRPFTLEMDNYFVSREHTPRDENGDYDFESLYALDLPVLNDHLNRLMKGENVQLRHFDFHTGQNQPGRTVQLSQNHIIVMEGIHGLNPDLVPEIPPDKVYRVYVSALTGLNIDRYNRVPTTDVRLLRRIVRDARHRGYTATDTLNRWQSVRRGEKRNIFPHQENANTIFNSAMPYELAALRPIVEPMLLQITDRTPAHIEAKRLMALLQWVAPLTAHQVGFIPDTSLLREFIGGSVLNDYHPGQNI